MPYHDELLRIIRDVRTRWRWKVVLRSVTVLVGAAILALLGAAYGLEQFRFSPAAIIVFRVLMYVVLVALGWYFFVRPLGRRVTDQQVALYLEEHEPSLQELLVSAVEAGSPSRSVEQAGESALLLRQVVKSAVERCQASDAGRGLERESLRTSAVALGIIVVVATVVFTFGPAYLRQGAFAVLVPVTGAEAASPYRIEVTPGSVTVARGSDLSIKASLHGFTATEVDLFTRATKGAPFERVPMVAPPGEGPFENTIFRVKESFEYFVQAAGVRSPVYEIEAAALPFVERMEMELVYPAYTGLPPRMIDQGGDIAVLRGTTVRLRVHPTMKTGAGRVVRDGKDGVGLTVNADGTLAGSFQVMADGIYRVDLADAAGTLVTASPQYTIDVLTDEPPAVVFSKPARDLRATSVDEIFVEASAADDYGVKQLELVWSVNGGPERQARLAGSGGPPRNELSAGHTFFLEELGLQPGDAVSYYARATDNDEVSGAKSVTSDIFFLQIQPFRKDYRAAESQAGGQQAGGQGAGGNNDPSALSEQQRRIVSGTFNVVRDRAKAGEDKFRQDVVFLALTQGQLRERADALSAQIKARVAQADPAMVTIAGALQDAAKAMQGAEQRLQVRDAKGALPGEQQALAHLQRAEEAYRDVRVRMSQERGGGGGGGGGQQSAASEELANLFQLEMDKLRNQYETVQRSQQQGADAKVDEMLERLKELARRQEQEAERQRQMAGGRQAAGSAGSARQRQLADETEEAARQLERLSREDDRQDLAQMARDLRSAADAMRRAAASGDSAGFAEARAAADRLSQTRDGLEQQRSDRMARDIDGALARTRRLTNEQKSIEAGVRGLDKAGAARAQQVQQLQQRKEAEAAEVADIEKLLDRTASDFRRERPQAARQVQEAADGIRDDRLKEKINYSRGLVQGAPAATAADFEQQIGADIASLESRLRAAAGSVNTPVSGSRADAMSRARALARGVGSMEQRLRDQQQAAQASRQAGERGQTGQQAGQSGERGQGGQQGGQSGERGQGGQQAGQAGERGQGGQGGGQQGDRGQMGQASGQRADGGQTGLAGGQGGLRQGGDRLGGMSEDASRLRGDAGGPIDPRQFQREARERRTDAQALRRELQALGVDVKDLDSVIGALAALDSTRVYADPDEISRLQRQLAETLQRFQFSLRRDLGAADAEQLLLAGPDSAPEAYKKQIEEYYRSLARNKKK
jgi:hypothetical protein